MDLSLFLFLLLYPVCSSLKVKFRKGKRSSPSSHHLCFPVIGDIGGVPYPPFTTPSQKEVAALLGKVTGQLRCQFVVGVGDNFYFDGVSNISDPRFQLTFERPYELINLPWYMIAGNHDHIKNVSAQIGYAKINNRWKYPFFYYSQVHAIPDSNKKIQIVMIDTTILCWNRKVDGIPDADVQWKWIEKQLKESTSDYLTVAGHHPVLSGGFHGSTECLIRRLKPLLEKYKVSAYFSGHDHNLQHIKENETDVHYFVSGSGNFVDGRMWKKDKLQPGSLKFENGVFGGFAMVRASDKSMHVTLINTEPKEVWKLKIYPREMVNRKTQMENATSTSSQGNDNESIFDDPGSFLPSNMYTPLYSPAQPQNMFSPTSSNPFYYNKWFFPSSVTQNIMDYARGINLWPLARSNQGYNYFTTPTERDMDTSEFPLGNYQLMQAYYSGSRTPRSFKTFEKPLAYLGPKITNMAPALRKNISTKEKSMLANRIPKKSFGLQKSYIDVGTDKAPTGAMKISPSKPRTQKSSILDNEITGAKVAPILSKKISTTKLQKSIPHPNLIANTKTTPGTPKKVVPSIKKYAIPDDTISTTNIFSMIPEKTSILKNSIINTKTLDTTEFDSLIFQTLTSPFTTELKSTIPIKTTDKMFSQDIDKSIPELKFSKSALGDKKMINSSTLKKSMVPFISSHSSSNIKVSAKQSTNVVDEAMESSWD